MIVRLAHGSTTNGLHSLEPQYIRGNNGSQAGIGVNMTADAEIAVRYADKTGSVYFIDTDISGFLTVSENVTISAGQSEILKMHLRTLPDVDQYRLASDFCGKSSKVFDNDKDAEHFYKSERQAYKDMGFTLDRLKPEIDYADDGRMMILYANKSFDNLTDVTTKRLHYALNLFDNSIATSLLKTISPGLILERENGKHHYLSFRNSEPITDVLDSNFLAKPNAIDVIQRTCDRFLNLNGPTIHSHQNEGPSL